MRFSRASLGAFIALAVLVLLNAVFTTNFATVSNFWSILWQVSAVVIVAVGMTLVIAIGGIDLSVGSVMALAGALMAVQLGNGVVAAIVIALFGAVAVGAVNGALIARRSAQPIVVTLATLIAVRGIAQVASHDGQLVPIKNAALDTIGRGNVGPIPIPVLIAGVVVILAALIMRVTAFGRYILATGGNPAAARLAGVPVQRTIISVYMLCAFLAALAGMLEAARIGASDAAKIGLNMELDAIAAAVIGGTVLTGGRASIVGTVAGALVMQVIATSFNMLLVPYAWSLVLKALIIVAAVATQRPRKV